MRSASGSRLRRTAAAATVAAAAAVLAGALARGSAEPTPARTAPFAVAELRHAALEAAAPTLSGEGRRALAAAAWVGGVFTTAGGEQVRVYVSDAYGDAASALGQRWADVIVRLVHGSELSALTAYVAPTAEVHGLCGSEWALGCYGSDRLVTTGDGQVAVSAEQVVTHEYGHHVAGHRSNPPWSAIDWGPKRWASAAGVCARVKQGTAFPGDEGEHYRQNPGEGFAEAYRALNEAKAGATSFSWPIVDAQFYPDPAALQAVEQDVVAPWTATVTETRKARFTKGAKAWTLRLATPLDGDLAVTLRVPQGALHDLALLGDDGRTVLARGLWSGPAEKRLTATVCGQRELVVRVARRGPGTAFTLQVSHA